MDKLANKSNTHANFAMTAPRLRAPLRYSGSSHGTFCEGVFFFGRSCFRGPVQYTPFRPQHTHRTIDLATRTSHAQWFASCFAMFLNFLGYAW
jgi:hypothetical protein